MFSSFLTLSAKGFFTVVSDGKRAPEASVREPEPLSIGITKRTGPIGSLGRAAAGVRNQGVPSKEALEVP